MASLYVAHRRCLIFRNPSKHGHYGVQSIEDKPGRESIGHYLEDVLVDDRFVASPSVDVKRPRPRHQDVARASDMIVWNVDVVIDRRSARPRVEFGDP